MTLIRISKTIVFALALLVISCGSEQTEYIIQNGEIMSIYAKQVDFLNVPQFDPTTNARYIDGYVKVLLAGTSTLATIYSARDKSGTYTNPVQLDSDATKEMFLDGVFDFEFYEGDPSDGGVKRDTLYGLDYRAFYGSVAENVAELKGIDGYPGEAFYLLGYASAGDGGEGMFFWDSSDLSASVTIDTESGVYVPPDSDSTGASGAWVRQYDRLYVEYFGAVGDNTEDDTDAINCGVDVAVLDGVRSLYLRNSKSYKVSQIDIPAKNFTLKAEVGHIENQAQDNLGSADIVSNTASTDLIVVDNSEQVSNIWFENIRFIANATPAKGVTFQDTSTYTPYNCGTRNCAFIGFTIGYFCHDGFYNKHERTHFWNNSVAGHYGWDSVSNEYHNVNVGLVPENAIGIWSLGKHDTIISSSSSSATSETGSIMWRVGADVNMTDPRSGSNYSSTVNSIANFISPHFEGTKLYHIDVASGCQVHMDTPQFVTATEITAAIHWAYLDNLNTIESPEFSGTFTQNFLIDSREKGSGGLMITPTDPTSIPTVDGITAGDGLYYLTSPSVVRAYSDAAQAVTEDLETTVAFNKETTDFHNSFASNQYTVDVPGIYNITAAVEISSLASGKYIELRIYHNSSQRGTQRVYSQGNATTTVITSDIVVGATDDTIDVRVYHDDTTARNLVVDSSSTYIIVNKL